MSRPQRPGRPAKGRAIRSDQEHIHPPRCQVMKPVMKPWVMLHPFLCHHVISRMSYPTTNGPPTARSAGLPRTVPVRSGAGVGLERHGGDDVRWPGLPDGAPAGALERCIATGPGRLLMDLHYNLCNLCIVRNLPKTPWKKGEWTVGGRVSP